MTRSSAAAGAAAELRARERAPAESEVGYPDGEGFPTLKNLCTPSTRRGCLAIKNILKQNIGIDVELDVKDFPVLIDQFQKMDHDLCRLGSGGDYDPDDGLVDWERTDSKFNGRHRDMAKMPFGFFSDPETRSATCSTCARRPRRIEDLP